MSAMADRSSGSGTERKRLKTLAQAALNADVTVGQLEDVLDGLGGTMNELNSSLSHLNATIERLGGGLDHLEETMSSLDDLARRLVTLIEPVEAIVSRIDYLVEVGETAMAPLTATENAVRGVFNAMRNRVVR
ncbi:ATPase [Mycolicibacter arupensis]|uniref:ATPase n=1 Tax=Mycolicibacter arupensis TaxID=342002 RepID=A0A0F5N221_9MYCO|nr:ATPase [Mycolicibacter arupensis]KAA1432110.1 ATPase [Mycolicibacter arupensis]KKC01002.1 ATPase [Mycolicibacter arupensis]MCV7275449.1 ATPase [Mycolicibacter arupensis]ORA00547.1 ATPase [Mycolicibacter arupensis]TXI58219.1 MAG: ATPase [Mycolicibacter arupensis]